jgi:hypothetical protein
MLKDLAKLATDMDHSGLHKEAERIDFLLEKLAGVYKSQGEGSKEEDTFMKWYDRDTFNALGEQEIAVHYLTQKNMFGVNTPSEYMEKFEIQDWQKDKVMKAIRNNPPSPSFQPQWQADQKGYLYGGGSKSWKGETMPMGDVNPEQLVKLLIADKDDGVQYKMSGELFNRIKGGEDLDFQDLSPADLAILKIRG